MATGLSHSAAAQWEIGQPELTGTTGPADATRLVTGTVVNVLGIGSATATPGARLRITGIVSFPPIAVRRSTESTSVSVTKRRATAARKRARTLELRDPLRVVFPQSSQEGPGEPIVLQERIRVRSPQNSSVRLIGAQGSASRPRKKYYDLDLDEFQFE